MQTTSHPDIAISIDESATVDETVTFSGRGSITVGPFTKIGKGVILDLGSGGTGSISLGSRSSIKPYSVIRCYDSVITLAHRSTIGEFCLLAGHGSLKIGDHVIVASHCCINAAGHIYEGTAPIRFQGETAEGIVIEDGAWLGTHVTILDKVVVGAGAIIGAGAVVTKSVAPKSLAIGVPAKVIKELS